MKIMSMIWGQFKTGIKTIFQSNHEEQDLQKVINNLKMTITARESLIFKPFVRIFILSLSLQ